MLFRTHIAIAATAALTVLNYAQLPLGFFVAALAGAALPDIDHPASPLGRFFKPVSWLFEHRGFWHSALAAALWVIPVALAFGSVAVLGLLLGFACHVLADAATPHGIMPLHPFSRLRLRGPIRTGSAIEAIIFWVAVALAVFALLV